MPAPPPAWPMPPARSAARRPRRRSPTWSVASRDDRPGPRLAAAAPAATPARAQMSPETPMNPPTALPLDIGPIHFIGIGGIGMSGIAEVLLTMGYEVQGSDLKESA